MRREQESCCHLGHRGAVMTWTHWIYKPRKTSRLSVWGGGGEGVGVTVWESVFIIQCWIFEMAWSRCSRCKDAQRSSRRAVNVIYSSSEVEGANGGGGAWWHHTNYGVQCGLWLLLDALKNTCRTCKTMKHCGNDKRDVGLQVQEKKKNCGLKKWTCIIRNHPLCNWCYRWS